MKNFKNRHLFLKLGYIFGISKDIRPKTTVIEGRTVNQRESYTVGGYCRNLVKTTSSLIEDGYVWYAPFKIEKQYVENERVYNFEVEEDNSYVANGVIVHNCQDLSIAKKDRKGLSGERSGLFYEALRLIKEVKPKFFIAENVNSMHKDMKELITQELFGIPSTMINSALLTAQNRKRLYFVGRLKEDGTYEKVDIEQPQDKGVYLKDILESGLPETQIDTKF